MSTGERPGGWRAGSTVWTQYAEPRSSRKPFTMLVAATPGFTSRDYTRVTLESDVVGVGRLEMDARCPIGEERELRRRGRPCPIAQ